MLVWGIALTVCVCMGLFQYQDAAQSQQHLLAMNKQFKARLMRQNDQIMQLELQVSALTTAEVVQAASTSASDASHTQPSLIRQHDRSSRSEPHADLAMSDEIAEQTSHQYIDTLRYDAQLSHSQEQREDLWAGQQEDRITLLLQQQEHFAGITLDYVDCRTSTCLVELTLSEQAPKHSQNMLAGLLGDELPNAVWDRQGNRLSLQLSRD